MTEQQITKQWWLIALCLVVQTVFTAYLALWQPVPKIDAKLLTVTNAILDLEARAARTEQDNAVLFRMLRNGNDRYGVIPETVTEPASVPLHPVTPPDPKRISGEPLGEVHPPQTNQP